MALPGIDLDWLRAILATGENLIDDAYRQTGVQGDGRAIESSVGIWPAATNLAKNGGAETNVNYLHQDASLPYNAVTRVTTQHKFGAACFQYVSTRTNNLSIAYMLNVASGGTLPNDAVPVTAGLTYTLSVWTKIVTPLTEHTPPFTNFGQINWYDAANALISFNQNFTWMPATAHDWTRWALTATAPTGAVKAVFFPVIVSNRTGTFYVDGIQFAANPVATPYIETDGATATRSAGRLRLSASGLDETAGCLAIRLRTNAANTAITTGDAIVWRWRDDANNYLELRYDWANARWEFQRRNTGGAAQANVADTFAAGAEITLIAKWDATTVALSVDGGTFTSAANTNIPILSATTFDVGSDGVSAQYMYQDVFWLATGSGAPSNADAATIHAFGNTDPTNDSFPEAAALTGMWHALSGATEDFVQYNVYRRLSGETDWDRIAVIEDVADIDWTDYLVKNGSTYEYTVTVTVDSGGLLQESEKDATPPSLVVAFTGAFLHDVADPANFLQWLGKSITTEPKQDIEAIEIWGKAKPITQVGQLLAAQLSLEGIPFENTNQETWESINALREAQRDTNAVLAFRRSSDESLRYVRIMEAPKNEDEWNYRPTMRLQEVDHTETV